jgi:hypothetical protein
MRARPGRAASALFRARAKGERSMTRSLVQKAVRAAVLVAAVVSSGCAEEREPINRVQANALQKSYFVGKLGNPDDDPEFYASGTVIDVPYGTDSLGVFPGLVGGVKRAKFEILEDVLNVRMTYEEIDGVDGHGSRTTNNGRVIAAYAIDSHFDIRRGYNSSTGEELNVVEENTSDRPWYDREYMRVNWSTNLITSSTWWDPISQQAAFGDTIDAEPLAYYVDDPNHPDAPHFAAQEGYFDITNRMSDAQRVRLPRQHRHRGHVPVGQL